MQPIAQGAEAKLYRIDNSIIKDRIAKSYRLRELDLRLRKQRTANEANLLRSARRAGVAVPVVLEEKETEIRMEWIDGELVKNVLNPSNCKELGTKIGIAIGKLHTYDIIHGDLTTSNMLLKNDKIYFIDFGLGFHSSRDEDKAVDLWVLHGALASTHHALLEKIWTAILEGYRSQYDRAESIIKNISEIAKRGRYQRRGCE
jgi:Kae1-associated kinase Bud32